MINLDGHNLRDLQTVITILTQFEVYGVDSSKDIKQRLSDHVNSTGNHTRVSRRIQKAKPTPSKLNDMAKNIPLCPECKKRMKYYLYDKDGVSTLNLDNVQDGEYFCVDCSIGQYVETPLNTSDEVI